MRILNLFAGIGGNRLFWNNHSITSIEYDNEIAKIYKSLFPKDILIIDDCIKWLNTNQEKLSEFDFIWASPPCITHTQLQMYRHRERKIPDLTGIYGLKIFFDAMSMYHKFKFVIENVQPWYKVVIPYNAILGRHYFWSNFFIPNKTFELEFDTNYENKNKNSNPSIKKLLEKKKFPDFELSNHNKKRQIVRNLVMPDIGKYILEQSTKQSIIIDKSIKQNNLFNFIKT